MAIGDCLCGHPHTEHDGRGYCAACLPRTPACGVRRDSAEPLSDNANALLHDLEVVRAKLQLMVIASEASAYTLTPEQLAEAQRCYMKHLRAAMTHVESARVWLATH